MVKKAIVLSVILLCVLFGVLVTMMISRNNPKQQGAVTVLTPTEPYSSPSPPQQTAYPEYSLPSPESVGPEEPFLTYDKASKEQQEFSTLTLEVPIKTSEYSISFNFANSTFDVDIYSEEGLKEYLELRRKYPNLKDDIFNIREHVADSIPLQ